MPRYDPFEPRVAFDPAYMNAWETDPSAVNAIIEPLQLMLASTAVFTHLCLPGGTGLVSCGQYVCPLLARWLKADGTLVFLLYLERGWGFIVWGPCSLSIMYLLNSGLPTRARVAGFGKRRLV